MQVFVGIDVGCIIRAMVLPPKVEQRIERQPGDGCWNWVGHIALSGYGLFWVAGRDIQVLAHRLVYQLLVGEIPFGLCLDHLCRNKRCVNPKHLEPVTLVENFRRGRILKTHCKHGHPLSGDNLLTISTRPGRHCKTCYDVRRHLYWAKPEFRERQYALRRERKARGCRY